MDIKLISVDLDKTLLRNDETVSRYTLDVLSVWKKRGARIVVSTSRSYFSARSICRAVMPDAVISSGGVEAHVGEECVYSAYLSEDVAKKCIEKCIADKSVSHIMVVGEREDLTNNPSVPFGELEYGHYKRTDFSEIPKQRVGKISVFSDCPQEIAEYFSADSTLRFIPFCIGRNGHKLSARGANKGDALLSVLEYFSVRPQNVISFGDDTPDIDMFYVSGISVAMENASETVRSAANYVCGSNENDGVARFLSEQL